MKGKKTVEYAFRASLPVMAGYLVLGMGFGVLLQGQGYGWPWAAVMSLVVYAGSMQYLAVDLLAGGAGLITTALMTLVVNFRHLFYGVTMLEPYRKMGRAKPYLIFALTDETFSLVCQPQLPEGVDRKGYYFWVSLLDQSYWVAGSVAGALAGSALGGYTQGIEFSMTALFVVIFLGQWEKTRDHRPALIGLGVSVLFLLLLGGDGFLIPSMVGITLALLLLKRFPAAGREEG